MAEHTESMRIRVNDLEQAILATLRRAHDEFALNGFDTMAITMTQTVSEVRDLAQLGRRASPPSPELREALIAAARNWFCECNPKGTDEKQLAVAVARAFPEDCQGKDTCTCGESDGCEECMTTAEIEARICQWESELAVREYNALP